VSVWRKFFIVLFIVAAITSVVIWCFPGTAPNSEPLLSGPPEFIILSLIAALALYLRQVNLNTLDLRYRIFHQELWNLPPEQLYRMAKLQFLQQTSDAILVASPFMFLLILAVCAWIIGDVYSRFYYLPRRGPMILYQLDILIVVWLTLTFIGLTFAHFYVRYYDDQIEGEVRARMASLFPNNGTGTN